MFCSAVRTRLLRVVLVMVGKSRNEQSVGTKQRMFLIVQFCTYQFFFGSRECISASLLKIPGTHCVFKLTSDCLVSQAKIWSNALPVGVWGKLSMVLLDHIMVLN